jgi:transcription antitermination factor NusG
MKKKIENFCPMNRVEIQAFRRNKILLEPLFKSLVFVNIQEDEISLVKQVDGVISFLHWMGKPAIIREDEVEAINDFTSNYETIELQKFPVNSNGVRHIVDFPIYSIEGKVFAIKNKKMKVNLPSLGYTMTVRMKDDSIFARETTILQNNSFSHS